MVRNLFSISLALFIAGVLFAPSAAQAINISISYQFDTQNFFGPQARRDVLEAAADVFRSFGDSLAAINPGTRYNIGTPQEFADTWTAKFDHPGQAGVVEVTDLAIPANTMVIYAGGQNLAGSTLGVGGPGGYSVNGIAGFVNAVSTRGESNATGLAPTDFGRWGGVITFDTLTSGGQPRNWHTNLNTLPPSNASDLYTVALHELGHLFGFAISSDETSPLSFETYLDKVNYHFTGPKVLEVHGGYALTATDGSAHWRSNVMSTTTSGTPQLAVLGPNIPSGVRREFTVLDYAAMEDIGWEVPASVYETPLPGDYDGNHIVNAADYSLWRSHFWSTSNLSADGNGNNRVDLADYTIWRDHLGAGSGAGNGGNVPIPEPAGMLLASLAGGSLWMKRRAAHLRNKTLRDLLCDRHSR